MNNKVLLVDASNLARRNYHGQDLRTTSGIRTGLIYGCLNSILSVQAQERAGLVIFVWDGKGSSDWRKSFFPMYKAGRLAIEPDYVEERKRFITLLDAMGVPQAIKDGAECDDIIGYLTIKAFADRPVSIVSTDKDFYQLISDRVSIVDPLHGKVIPDDRGRVPIKSGAKTIYLKPSQVVDYKCLVGDTSDNIPGAPGFGIGAAIDYFACNEGIDELLNSTAKISHLRGKAIEGLIAVRPLAPTFRKLCTLNLELGEVEVPSKSAPDKEMVQGLFNLYEFKQLMLLGEAIYNVGGLNA